MLNIDSIENGIVIDHITAGRSMRVYDLLELDKLDTCVAIIKNAKSEKFGKKDKSKAPQISTWTCWALSTTAPRSASSGTGSW